MPTRARITASSSTSRISRPGSASKLAFHFIGLGVGSRRHADRQGAYDSLRSAGFLGLCLSEQKVGNPLRARDYCKRALEPRAERSDRALPARQRQSRSVYNARQSCGYLKDARTSYVKMLELNPAPRRVEEREELRRADRRLPAAARMSGATSPRAFTEDPFPVAHTPRHPPQLSQTCSDRFPCSASASFAPWRSSRGRC